LLKKTKTSLKLTLSAQFNLMFFSSNVFLNALTAVFTAGYLATALGSSAGSVPAETQ
jgi:hypothetical protein